MAQANNIWCAQLVRHCIPALWWRQHFPLLVGRKNQHVTLGEVCTSLVTLELHGSSFLCEYSQAHTAGTYVQLAFVVLMCATQLVPRWLIVDQIHLLGYNQLSRGDHFPCNRLYYTVVRGRLWKLSLRACNGTSFWVQLATVPLHASSKCAPNDDEECMSFTVQEHVDCSFTSLPRSRS